VPRSDYLDRIVASHRERARSDHRDLGKLADEALSSPEPRGFADHIADSVGLAVIAEVKRRSPSKGDIAGDLDPASLAREYAKGGATCLSVLTDEEFFGGSPVDLRLARESCLLPVLRKDFNVSEPDVFDARIMGADAILLIAAVLDDPELMAFHTLARELEMDALVEVHDEAELERALEIGADLIGVNQRDLATFEVDSERALSMVRTMPPEVIAVAESGISGPEDAERLAGAGYQAVLVGESILKSSDRAAAVSALSAKPIGNRVAVGSRDS
jgi:indole-3-glycerol phosphate synthase